MVAALKAGSAASIAGTSTVVAAPVAVPADGVATSTVTVTLLDAANTYLWSSANTPFSTAALNVALFLSYPVQNW